MQVDIEYEIFGGKFFSSTFVKKKKIFS